MEQYVPLEVKKDFEINKIYSIHYFEYGNDYVYSGESHDFWEFCYVDKGEIVLIDDGHEFILTKGKIFFHKPGNFHSLKANGVVAPNLVVASFDVKSKYMNWFEGRTLAIGDKDRALLAQILDEADTAFSSALDDPELKQLERSAEAQIGAEQLIQNSLESLLISLYRNGNEQKFSTEKPSSLIKEKGREEQIDRVLEYMELNIDKQLSLEDICKDNLVGRSLLQKIFHEKTGGGAMEYFGKLKIKESKRMIREGRRNFTEIASELGYNSIHYFSRHFKKVTGMTPSEYASSVKILTQKSKNENK